MILTSISPLLNVREGAKAVDFYRAAFGARVVQRIDDDSGSVVALLAVDTSEFWIADESPDNLNYSPAALNGTTVRLTMTVEDPDAVFERAIEAGATVVYPVADQPYGWRVGRLVDPYGHHWEIGKPLS